MEKQNRKKVFFFLSENSGFLENGNWRILVLRKTIIGEFFFFFIRESSFFGNGEFSFCGKRELENSCFVENQNRRIFLSFFFFYPRILVLLKRRILVLWKTRTGEFSFCGKPESENFFFFFSSENSRFVENGNWRILVLWKTKIGEFFFFIREFSFC